MASPFTDSIDSIGDLVRGCALDDRLESAGTRRAMEIAVEIYGVQIQLWQIVTAIVIAGFAILGFRSLRVRR